MGVRHVTDLFNPAWVSAVRRGMRLVDFDPAWQGWLAGLCRHLTRLRSIAVCMQRLEAEDRRTASVHLRPAPIGALLDQLLDQFCDSLLAAKPTQRPASDAALVSVDPTESVPLHDISTPPRVSESDTALYCGACPP